MLPYKNLSSKHLDYLLLLVRVVTTMSLLTLFLSLIGIVYSVMFISGFGSNIYTIQAIAIFNMSLMFLFGAGLIAALIGFEESYRKKVKHCANERI